ncbi:uncharacterized protein LOC126968947 isoform X2 [Leptidea sinapis]|uniref:uncharacterized protein LOC126968947 isoform X2 n=1 Tax=Leptidea sinapis TaxID=189913 RepID=UPI0021C46A17|nr:uncharacterized protein LOC126968947 isoform X2 [Leptidea sinapis]
MHRLVNVNYLMQNNDTPNARIDSVQNFRQAAAVIGPINYKPNIRETLQNLNFNFRANSFSSLIRECCVTEGQTLLIFWACRSTDSRVTSMSASSCSSLQIQAQASGLSQGSGRNRELRSVAQQTDITSCRYPPGGASPVASLDSDEQRGVRERLADSLTYSSPASSLLQPPQRSISILGSVCALLLNTKASAAKEAAGAAGSPPSDTICRICFGGASAERLVRPCSCRGTIAAVHRSCLERWLLQAVTSHCELCRHHYTVTRTHKWSWARSVVEWARSGRGRALAADAWRGLALGAASVLGTARALHACDAALQAGARRGGAAALAANLFSSLLIGIIGALNGLLTTWMLLKIQEHQVSWRTWRDSTLHVRVTLDAAGDAAGGGAASLTSRASLASHDSFASLATVVGEAAPRADRATNITDPFMVAAPPVLPEF